MAGSANRSNWLPLRPVQPFHPLTREDARRYVGGHLKNHRLSFDGRTDFRQFFHGHARIGDLVMHSLRYGTGATVDVPSIKDIYLLQWTLEGSNRYVSRHAEFTADPNSLVIVSPGIDYRKSWSSDCLQLIVRVERQTVERHLARMTSADVRPLQFKFAPIMARPGIESLLRMIGQMARDWDDGGVGLAAPAVMPSTQRLLLDLLMQQDVDDVPRPLSPIVAAAVAYMWGRSGETPDLADMADHAGVSIRHLQRTFLAELDMAPLAYFRCLRLDQAHRDLTSGDEASITDVALRNGFDHLSRFATYYRARFGEAPSRTLRRARTRPFVRSHSH